VRNPFSSSQAPQPFLSPLGRQRRLPAVAVPAVLTVCGGVALVVAFGALFGLQPSGVSSIAAGPDVAEARAAPQARTVAVEREPEKPAQEDAETEDGEVVLEPVLAEGGEADLAPGSDSVLNADSERTAAIEPALPAEITAFAPQPRPTPPSPASAASPAADSAKRAAVVKRAVNMRAAPNGRAQVLTVVPASSEIRAEAGCSWCEIDYQGRSGFIYKSFIDYR
jgi:hypothetical protein